MNKSPWGLLHLPERRLDRPPLSPSHGAEPLGLEARRDGWFLASSAPGPRPLWLAFHGAGAHAQQMLTALREHAGTFGAHLLAVDSRRASWDLGFRDGEGGDTTFVQAALELACTRAWVDSAAVVAIGYSDGASYGLSLALRNRALFSHAIAYAPGFAAAPERGALPSVYLAHGRNDSVLPIDACGRRVAAQLDRWGAEVTLEEHDGTHALTPSVVAGGLRWLAAKMHLSEGLLSTARGAARQA